MRCRRCCTTAHPCRVCGVCSQLVQVTDMFNARFIAYVAISIASWLAFVLVYSFVYGITGTSSFRDFSMEGTHLLSQPAFWLLLPLVLVSVLLTDAVISLARRLWKPLLLDIVQEWDRCVALIVGV